MYLIQKYLLILTSRMFSIIPSGFYKKTAMLLYDYKLSDSKQF